MDRAEELSAVVELHNAAIWAQFTAHLSLIMLLAEKDIISLSEVTDRLLAAKQVLCAEREDARAAELIDSWVRALMNAQGGKDALQHFEALMQSRRK